jgi:hypothetical protein
VLTVSLAFAVTVAVVVSIAAQEVEATSYTQLPDPMAYGVEGGFRVESASRIGANLDGVHALPGDFVAVQLTGTHWLTNALVSYRIEGVHLDPGERWDHPATGDYIQAHGSTVRVVVFPESTREIVVSVTGNGFDSPGASFHKQFWSPTQTAWVDYAVWGEEETVWKLRLLHDPTPTPTDPMPTPTPVPTHTCSYYSPYQISVWALEQDIIGICSPRVDEPDIYMGMNIGDIGATNLFTVVRDTDPETPYNFIADLGPTSDGTSFEIGYHFTSSLDVDIVSKGWVSWLAPGEGYSSPNDTFTIPATDQAFSVVQYKEKVLGMEVFGVWGRGYTVVPAATHVLWQYENGAWSVPVGSATYRIFGTEKVSTQDSKTIYLPLVLMELAR